MMQSQRRGAEYDLRYMKPTPCGFGAPIAIVQSTTAVLVRKDWS